MVTIVTVNHDTPKFIELCVKAVRLRTPEPHRHIVVDNGSTPRTLNVLRGFKKNTWIELLERHRRKSSPGHGEALDWLLGTKQNLGRICLLDSDAYPICPGWLTKLEAFGGDAIGPQHFRDPSLLHPYCMLFNHADWIAAGRPTFMIQQGKVFNDTAMLVGRALRRIGKKVHSIPWQKMNELVLHRWRATRVESIGASALDGRQSVHSFNEGTAKWLRHPAAQEALKR